MVQNKTKEINIVESKGSFYLFSRKKEGRKDYGFVNLTNLRKVLNNEKARILKTIKTENPISIYDLAKKVERSFKPVKDDVDDLKKFGFIELKKERVGNRVRLKPILVADKIVITIKI